MSLITNIVNFLSADIRTTVITLIIGFVVYKLSKFYVKVWNLPPGPLPLPFIGNILLFKSKDHWDTVFRKVNKKYGPIFTFWMGSNPFVIISDAEIARGAFRKNEFAGRTESFFGNLQSNFFKKNNVKSEFNTKVEYVP